MLATCLAFILNIFVQTPLLIDLNQDNKIDAEEYRLVTQIFFADGYEIDDDGVIQPIDSQFKYEELEIVLPGDIPITFVRIPKGTFWMGEWSLNGWLESVDLEPAFVVISKDFYIGKYEITQQQYDTVMNKNPSLYEGSRFPVHEMGAEGAINFINALNNMDYEGDFRLPTSAEWEYACKAGTETIYYWGDNLGDGDDYEWTSSNSQFSPFPVGLLNANPWGLHDMQGNVSEYVLDGVVENSSSFDDRQNISLFRGEMLVDPVGLLQSSGYGFIRGGNIYAPSDLYRVYSDTGYIRSGRTGGSENLTGFRLVYAPFEINESNVDYWELQ